MFGWTVDGTALAPLLAVIGPMADLTLRLETRLGSRIDGLGRDLRAEVYEGFSRLGHRLRLLGHERP